MNVSANSSLVRGASSAGGAADQVGVSVLRKQIDLAQSQNAQLLQSVPQAPRPGGSVIDLYA